MFLEALARDFNLFNIGARSNRKRWTRILPYVDASCFVEIFEAPLNNFS